MTASFNYKFEGLFEEGKWELFEKEKYAAAQFKFEEILEKPEETSAILHQRAEYLRAKCAVELFTGVWKNKLLAFTIVSLSLLCVYVIIWYGE